MAEHHGRAQVRTTPLASLAACAAPLMRASVSCAPTQAHFPPTPPPASLHRYLGTGWAFNQYNTVCANSEHWTQPGGWADCDPRPAVITFSQVSGELRCTHVHAHTHTYITNS